MIYIISYQSKFRTSQDSYCQSICPISKTQVYFLKENLNVFNCFKKFKALVEKKWLYYKIINEGSCVNVTSTTLVRKLNLNSIKHHKPYKL